MVDRKVISFGVLAGFIALAFYSAFNADKIAAIIAADGLGGLFWYFISDFKNWLILVGVIMLPSASGMVKRVSAGILIALAADAVSYPRLLSVPPVAGEAIRASLDWVVVNVLPFSYAVNLKIYYLLLPIVFMVAAFHLLGYRTFLSQMVGK